MRLNRAVEESPHCARKIPKIHGRVVCDYECFAVDALEIERCVSAGVEACGCREEFVRCQQMGVCDVADVGEVEQVVVFSKLEFERGVRPEVAEFEHFEGE